MIRAGFSLLEVTIAMFIFSMVIVLTTETAMNASQLNTNMYDRMESAEVGHSVIHRVADELRAADESYIYNGTTTNGLGEVVESWSFKVCTGFDAAGKPIYDAGDFGRLLTYNYSTRIMRMEVQYAGGTSVEAVLTSDVLAFDIFPKDGSLLTGARMIMSLVSGPDIDETDPTAAMINEINTFLENNSDISSLTPETQRYLNRHLHRRQVFLRSTRYDTNGLNSLHDSNNSSGGTNNGDGGTGTGTGDTVDNWDTPDNQNDTDGADFTWSTNQETAPDVLVTIDLSTTAGYDVEPGDVALSFFGDDTAGLTWSYANDRITITGSSNATFGITAETTATKKNKPDQTTRQTQWF